MRMPFLAGLAIAAAAAVTTGCASGGASAGDTAAGSSSRPPATSPGSSPPATSPGSPAATSPGSGPGGTGPATAPPPAPGGTRACGPPAAPGPGDRALTLGTADNARTYCVTVGTTVLVLLKGTPGAKWGTIRAAGSALRPTVSGRMALMIGVTGAAFLAVRPGTAVISSARPVCASATPADAPCDAVRGFAVTVIVRG